MFFNVDRKSNQHNNNNCFCNQSKQNVISVCFHNYFLIKYQLVAQRIALATKLDISTNVLYTSKGKNNDAQKTPKVTWDRATESWTRNFLSSSVNLRLIRNSLSGVKSFVNHPFTPTQVKTLYPVRNQGSNGAYNSGAARFGPSSGSP